MWKCLLRPRTSLLLPPIPPFPQVLRLYTGTQEEASWKNVTVSFSSPGQECPCMLTVLLLQELGVASTAPGANPVLLGEKGQILRPGDELHPGQKFQTACGNW